MRQQQKNKTERLIVLLDKEEKRELESEARKRGVSIATIARERLFPVKAAGKAKT